MCSLLLFHSIWTTRRKIPIDMAGFAIELRLILTRPEVWIGRNARGRDSKVGQLETDFLEHFTTRQKVECRGLNSEVHVIYFYNDFNRCCVYMYLQCMFYCEESSMQKHLKNDNAPSRDRFVNLGVYYRWNLCVKDKLEPSLTQRCQRLNYILASDRNKCPLYRGVLSYYTWKY